MKQTGLSHRRRRRPWPLGATRAAAVIAAVALTTSSCAGGAGGSDEGASGEGFAYGAPQEDVDALLTDLDPVEITYQAGAQSPNSISALSATSFKEYVEERSGGKITVDLVYGQAIAGYGEIDDALADGRVDVAYTLPIYKPAEYPVYDAYLTASGGMPNSIAVGEMIGNAAVVDMGFNSDYLIPEFEEKGLTPLAPMVSTGAHQAVCVDAGTAPEDWKGRQVRIASVAHQKVASALGASPVSMEYVETFEALQRGTVNCTIAQLLPSEELGLLEIATHVAYMQPENSMSGRAAGATVAGIGYQRLPLAYQQIIFDSGATGLGASAELLVEGNVAAVRQLKGAGGEITEIDRQAGDIIGETNASLTAGVEESGLIGKDLEARKTDAVEKWTTIVEELGYADGGGFNDADEWYDSDEWDFAPYGQRLFEEVALPHRPS
ncbi:C4-dicarboxylate ABC transporter substrate-binding protein [Brevibacterium sp.]|uniref:C4-dicarboxylate ABC transporter substrate-binding protein n=1 Tax=Brevibacterium sp. TaxID=1701 RepID=UPI0025C08B84|nr:C4-dicarboxylate ABC transporter substrate-binding protein [Brevibacterium sp.]